MQGPLRSRSPRRPRALLLAALTAALLLFALRRADACKCESPPLAEAFAHADAVFEARVIGVEGRERGRGVVRLAVLRSWKGARAGDTVVIRRETLVMMCRFAFETTKTYLVFATHVDGALDVATCSRTRLAADAADDLAALSAGKMPDAGAP
jgi:hypothetical protein